MEVEKERVVITTITTTEIATIIITTITTEEWKVRNSRKCFHRQGFLGRGL